MEEKQPATVIKTEYIADEKQIDCFGNYDSREKQTCGICYLNKQCEITTNKLKSKKYSYRPQMKSSIVTAHQSLREAPEVVELVQKVKNKQKEVEKTMGDLVKKMKKKSGDEGEGKKLKKIKKDDGGGESEKKAGRPKKREEVEVLGKSTLPSSFKTLYKGIKDLGELEYKTSVTNVRGDSGILFCIPIIGRTSKKVEPFLNRSREYTGIKSSKHVEVKQHKKGELLLVVNDSKESQAEALEMLAKWKKDAPKHIAAHGGKRGPKGGGGEKKEGKVVKKSKDSSDDDEGKVVKKKSKDEKSEKKGPPVVKAKKAKPVEVDEDEG